MGKIHNLKLAAKRINFLTENKIEYYSELVFQVLLAMLVECGVVELLHLKFVDSCRVWLLIHFILCMVLVYFKQFC